MSDSTVPVPASADVSLKAVNRLESTDITASLSVVGSANAESISATGCAIATARASSLGATGSAVGLVQTDGDATVSLSAVPLIVARGDAEFRQAYASAFIAGGSVAVSQGGSPLIMGKQVTVDSGGAVAMVASDASVSNGWIGVLLAKNADLSDDTRVVFTTRATLILAAAVLGGFGLVALAMVWGTHRLSQWKPDLRFWKR